MTPTERLEKIAQLQEAINLIQTVLAGHSLSESPASAKGHLHAKEAESEWNYLFGFLDEFMRDLQHFKRAVVKTL